MAGDRQYVLGLAGRPDEFSVHFIRLAFFALPQGLSGLLSSLQVRDLTPRPLGALGFQEPAAKLLNSVDQSLADVLFCVPGGGVVLRSHLITEFQIMLVSRVIVRPATPFAQNVDLFWIEDGRLDQCCRECRGNRLIGVVSDHAAMFLDLALPARTILDFWFFQVA